VESDGEKICGGLAGCHKEWVALNKPSGFESQQCEYTTPQRAGEKVKI